MSEETTTEEVKGTPIVTEDNTEEYTGPVMDEPNVIKETDTAPSAREEQAKETNADEDVEDTKDEVPEEDEVEQITPAAVLNDPGEFEPNDHSFDVTVYDSEGKNGRTVKVNSVEQFDELVDKDANFGNGGELAKALRKANIMELKQAQDKEKYDVEKEAFEAQEQDSLNREARITQYESEVNFLTSKDKLPKVAKEYEDADWNDPDIAKQPGVKERIELLNYMRDENNTRIKAGLPPMTSVMDAFNALKLEQAETAQVEAHNRAGQARRAAGARVAGNSANPVSVAPKGISVGRNLGGLQNMGNDW